MELVVSPYVLAAEMPESRGPDSLDSHVRGLAAELGLWAYHNQRSEGSARGWVDWVVMGKNGVLFREGKSQDGELTPDQRLVGARLERSGHNWAVWRPIDWLNGTIRKQMEAIR
jgi:hypothetical protein